MALVIADRVRETTTTTGTGTITLAGAVANFETFTANLSNSDTTYYSIVDNTNGAFEVGLGTFTASGTTLAGTKDVFITIPASKMIVKDTNGNVSIDGDVTVADGSNDLDVASHDGTNGLKLGGNIVTSSAAELNILTGKSFVDEDNMASNSATAIPSQQSVKAYVDTQLTAEDLDVTTDSGTIDIDLDSETLTIAGGTGLSSSASSTTVTMAVDAAQTGITSVVNSSLEIGRDADNRIKFGTDNQIIFEVDGGDNVIFKASGEIEATSLDVSGDIDVDGTTNLDNTDIDGTLVVDGSNISLDSTSTLNIDNSNTSNGITIGTATSGVPISIGHTTSEVTVNDNLTVTGDLTVSGTTTTVNSTTVNLNDHNLVLDSGNSTSAVVNGAGITIEGGSGDDATFSYNTTGPKFELKLGSSHEDLQVDQLIAASLDISGNVDVDGTLEADAITVDGTALNTVIAGVTVANATTAAVATTVTISDNESTNEDNAIVFTSGGDVDGGNIGLESDGDLTYNPSTGRLTATQLAGTLQTAAQSNVTSLGTLTTLTVDNVIINGSTIGHTGDTDLMTVASGVLTVAGEVDATSLDISGDADIDGTLEADAITVNGTALATVIADEATALAIALG